MQGSWKEYLTFTKKERTGIIILIILIAFCIALPFFFTGSHQPPDKTAFDKLNRQLEQLQVKRTDSVMEPVEKTGIIHLPASRNANQGALFEFDPNTLTTTGWQKLGLQNRTIRTIQNYLARGGHFHIPGDLGKIYGMHEEELKRLLPFVRIYESGNGKKVLYNKQKTDTTGKSYYRFTGHHSIPVIDINTADTADWIALPGIGNRLAQRIINFREKLGGFYTVDQVGETYGVPDSTF